MACTSLLLIITLRFTCGERKIYPTIKKSQNIMNMIGDTEKQFTLVFQGDSLSCSFNLIFHLYSSYGAVLWLLFSWKIQKKPRRNIRDRNLSFFNKLHGKQYISDNLATDYLDYWQTKGNVFCYKNTVKLLLPIQTYFFEQRERGNHLRKSFLFIEKT